MKRVIINADDFGLSPGVNRGILNAMQEGLVTSTTMMVNMPSFDDAVTIAQDHPQLPIGVHLTLLWGKPVSDPAHVPTLVDSSGNFPRSLTVLARRYFLGRIVQRDVVTEFTNQLRKFTQAGLTPTHLDTHKQIHCLPGILEAMIDVAHAFKITKMRFPVEKPLRRDRHAEHYGSLPRPSVQAVSKRRLVCLLSRNNRWRLQQAAIRTTDHFLGMDFSDMLDADVLLFLLHNIADGDTEIMCHPGYIDTALRDYSRIPPHRDIELASLQDPRVRNSINTHGIELISFRDL